MTDAVGYKQPPAATRWKKGQSGNPSGRKRGTPNLKTDLIAELGEMIQISEGGVARRISKQRALLKSLTARGIKGDARAANVVLSMVMRLFEPEQNDAQIDVSARDKVVFEDYLARLAADKGEAK